MHAALRRFKTISVFVAASALIGTTANSQPVHAGDIPTFAIDAG